MFRPSNIIRLACGILPLLSGAAQAQSSAAELAKQALNPVAAMYSLPVQYNWNQNMGPTGDGMHSVTNIQPVLPFELNATFLQPFLSYTTSTFTTFGVNTESTYNWQAQEWSVPVNVTVTQLLKLGGQPLTVQAGPRYWADSPENGAQGWGFRAAVTLLFPR